MTTGVEPTVSSRVSLPPWQQHKLMRELAAGERSSADLAREYGMGASGIREFKRRNRAQIAAIAADLANEFAGLWIADKMNRIAAYAAEFERASEHKAADHHEWIKARTQILHLVAEELGQLPPRQTVTVVPVQHVIIGVDTSALT